MTLLTFYQQAREALKGTECAENFLMIQATIDASGDRQPKPKYSVVCGKHIEGNMDTFDTPEEAIQKLKAVHAVFTPGESTDIELTESEENHA